MKKFLGFAMFSYVIIASRALAFTSTASGCDAIQGLGNLLCRINELLNSVIPVLVALGVVYLVWGIVQYVIGDSEEAKKKGRDRIIFGIIGMAVIISVWGLTNIIVNTFKLDSNNEAPTSDKLQKLLPQ